MGSLSGVRRSVSPSSADTMSGQRSPREASLGPATVGSSGKFHLWLVGFLFLFLLLLFRATLMIHGSSWARMNSCCSCQSTPQPQQCQIQATSVTYTTAHGNAGSFNPVSKARDQTPSSWTLVGFVAAEPQWELQFFSFLKKFKKKIVLAVPMVCRSSWARDQTCVMAVTRPDP